jgi:hypothetical protein
MYMVSDQEDRRFDLRFTGGLVEQTGAIPASVLAQSLEGLQRLVHLIGMRNEGRELNKRARPSRDIQQRYAIMCRVPEKGSYIEPIEIGGAGSQLLDPVAALAATKNLRDFFAAVSSQDENTLDRAIPDPTYRRFMLDAFANFLPADESQVQVEVRQNGKSILNGARLRGFVDESRKPNQSEIGVGIITGYFQDIDFAKQRLSVLYPPTQKKIACYYNIAIEAMLLEHPRELIQVRGQVERDDDGNPKEITDVNEIFDIDLDPIAVHEFFSGNRRLVAATAISAAPQLDETQQFYSIQIPVFGIEAFAETRDELIHSIASELDVLWRHYAQAPDNDLTDEAIALKKALLSAFSEGQDAA